MAATIGAGIQDGELYDNLAKHDAMAVGGENLVCACPAHPVITQSLSIITNRRRMLELSDGPLAADTASQPAHTAWERTVSSKLPS